MNASRLKTTIVGLPILLAGLLIQAAAAGPKVGTLCRVKGQEENTLHAMGLVVGLKGTGDSGNFSPTIRSLAIVMERMGTPLGSGDLAQLKSAKNAALVHVSATIPPAGARQGDRIDCVVSAVGSSADLTGGRLVLTYMLGPVPSANGEVFAIAEGDITVEAPDLRTKGKIHAGCRLEQEFPCRYVRDGKLTLVLKPQYAGFRVAQEVSEMINGPQLLFQSGSRPIAKAIDAVNIEVEVPRQYLDDPVHFIRQVLELDMVSVPLTARVVINERAGSIVISGDVEIAPVAIAHRNIVVETGEAAGAGPFVPVDPADPQNPKLKSLVTSLNAINVPAADIIEIIKLVNANGALTGELVFE